MGGWIGVGSGEMVAMLHVCGKNNWDASSYVCMIDDSVYRSGLEVTKKV